MPRSPSLRTKLENSIYLWVRLCKHARSMKRQNFAGTREAGAGKLRNAQGEVTAARNGLPIRTSIPTESENSLPFPRTTSHLDMCNGKATRSATQVPFSLRVLGSHIKQINKINQSTKN